MEKEQDYKIVFNWKNVGIIAGFSLLVIILLAGGSYLAEKRKTAKVDKVDTTSAVQDNAVSDELKIDDLVVGEGEEAVNGKTVSVHYTGTLLDGKKFDSSLDRGTPFEFTLGAGRVIEGWDKGVLGMKVGGKRKLTIPSKMGYGEQGAGDDIPPNSTLLFEIELLEVK